MTKRELLELKYLKEEIEQLKKQLEDFEFKVVTDSVTGSSPYFPYVSHSIKITGVDERDFEVKTSRIRKQIKNRIEDLMDKTAKLNEYISTVPDSEMRIILSYRYINGLTWEEIGVSMNYATSTVRNKHDKFIKFSTN
jgi:DNA-directed RNA polymerase specialized sigma subunit